ncbi:MAG: ABC transporter permease [Bacillota bacterium]
MYQYLVRRLFQIIPVILGVSIIVFILLRLTGDPAVLMLPEDALEEEIEALRDALGLNEPLHVQYWVFLTNALRGDFGRSFRYRAPALEVTLERIPATLELAGSALLFAVVISVPLGIISAIRQNTAADLFASTAAVLGRAMPNFWLGIMLILVFGVMLRWLPVSGREGLSYLILPAITLGTGLAATITRLVRSSMLEVIRQDYITTARSKGLSERSVIYRHALRNALIPVVTIIGIQVAVLMGGSVITEAVFAWPGAGRLAIQALYMRDMALVQAVVIVKALIVIFANLAVDLIYTVIDPRIMYS